MSLHINKEFQINNYKKKACYKHDGIQVSFERDGVRVSNIHMFV